MESKNLVFLENSIFSNYFLETNESSLNYLPMTNTINIFIGSNNSGKSLFMRKFMAQKEFLLVDAKLFKEYNRLVQMFNREIKLNNYYYHPQHELKQLKNDLNINNVINENSNKLNNARYNIEYVYLKQLGELLETLVTSIINPKFYFIPTLRTAHSLYQLNENHQSDNRRLVKYKKIEEDILQSSISKYYSLNENVEVFTGMHLYRAILNARNSNRITRNRFSDFEEFVGKSFFNGNTIDIVAEFNKEKSLKGENDGENISIHFQDDTETRYLYELGDGIQALIVVMYTIFMAEENSFVIIDEPELNLHPGMQRLFLEQISSNPHIIEKNLTFFISTHSNHFLDLTIEKKDISIYSFKAIYDNDRQKKIKISNVNSGDNELLINLGVNNSSVFMANCSIWVEGISDRNLIKAFLSSYLDYLKESDDYKIIKEDIDYAFFEYAGSNYLHYDFKDEGVSEKIKAFALSNKIMFISDLDSDKDEKHQALNEIAKNNFVYKTTKPFREIENLLPNKVWETILIDFRNKNHYPLDVNDVIQLKIKSALDKTDFKKFKHEYIGVFLKKLNVKELRIIWEGTVNSPKTFKYKTELSNLVLQKVLEKKITWNDFKNNPVIVKLTKEIYEFITNK